MKRDEGSYALNMAMLIAVILAAATLMSTLRTERGAVSVPRPAAVALSASIPLEALEVRAQMPGEDAPHACSPVFFGARVCGQRPWERVGPQYPADLADGRERPCYWMHPIADGQLQVDVPLPPGVEGDEPLELDVLFGLLPDSAEGATRNDISISVSRMDCELASWAGATRRWSSERVPLTNGACATSPPGASVDDVVRLNVESTRDQRRLLCVDLRWRMGQSVTAQEAADGE